MGAVFCCLNGHLEFVKMFHKLFNNTDSRTATAAMIGCHIHGLRATLRNLCRAAELDDMKMVKFLRDRGCDWNCNVFQAILRNHSLEKTIEILHH